MFPIQTIINIKEIELHKIIDFTQVSPKVAVLLGERQVQQKLSTPITLQESLQQKPVCELHFIDIPGQVLCPKPYTVQASINLLSEMTRLDDAHILLLTSKSGNRALCKFNIETHQLSTVYDQMHYKEQSSVYPRHQAQATNSNYKIFAHHQMITIVELHYYIHQQLGEQVLVEVTNLHEDGAIQQMSKKFSLGGNLFQLQVKPVLQTTQLGIINSEQIYYASDQIVRHQQTLHPQLKVKFIIAIQNHDNIYVVKDRVDKFYKVMIPKEECEYFKTLKPHEIEKLKQNVETKRRSSLNLLKHKKEFYIILSSIYKMDQISELYCNLFMINNQNELEFMDVFLAGKGVDIDFLQKDLIIRDGLFFQMLHQIKFISFSL